ncbi:MAG: NAD-dependent deacylase [Verrucomicrobiota bacterium]
MSERVVVLTGAGISADSGLATFRDAGGLWEGRRPEEVATPEAFVSDPAMVHRFYNSRRLQLRDAEPNDAHRALVEWEKATPDFLLVTQNVDDLHERAGSGKLRHMHGELKRVKCEFCDHDRPEAGEISTETVCEKCGQGGGMRPAVVWFGEMPLHMEEIFWALDACTLFVSIGTSGNVYPAAGFVDAANRTGARTVELNLEPSTTASAFRECIHGRAAEIVPAFVERFL